MAGCDDVNKYANAIALEKLEGKILLLEVSSDVTQKQGDDQPTRR